MVAPYALYASCAPGLESLLEAELRGLGALEPTARAGGVELSGHRKLIARVNLESGLASHLRVRLGAVVAWRFDALERELGTLPFEAVLLPGVPRSFRVSAQKSRLIHTGAIAERAARAIARRLGDNLSEPSDDGVPVLVRIVKDRAEVSVDTSGAPLHRRGYRLDPGAAPLREDLARALVIASGWDPTTPLVDPFSGVGTIPIEAMTIARGLAPGRLRDFAFQRTALFDAATWERVREAAEARVTSEVPEIVGADRSEDAIASARENAARAGVAPTWTCAPVSELDLGAMIASEAGALVTDPPHGRRLDTGDLSPLYRALGRRVAELPRAWRVAIYAADRRLALRVGSDLKTAFLTDAGGLKLRALVRGA